jgi:hypothetical protein
MAGGVVCWATLPDCCASVAIPTSLCPRRWKASRAGRIRWCSATHPVSGLVSPAKSHVVSSTLVTDASPAELFLFSAQHDAQECAGGAARALHMAGTSDASSQSRSAPRLVEAAADDDAREVHVARGWRAHPRALRQLHLR